MNQRLLVLWCPDWPVVAAGVAAGIPADRPAAVFSANRVVTCSAVARANGVRRGMRRRDAQGACPELAVLGVNPARDARLFEPVAGAVQELVVGVDVVRPGVVAVPAEGAAGYFGGEDVLVERLLEHVSEASGVECQIGIAGGLFTAILAARRSVVVGPGRDAEFLAPLRIEELTQLDDERAELVDLLRRLGLRTLGQFAELPERLVASRFGQQGTYAHRFAQGRSERPLARRYPTRDLAVVETFDPALDRIDSAAFAARTLAIRLHSGLVSSGLACTRLGIYAVTESGEELARVWRCAEPVNAQGIADRVRWQFEGWLRAGTGRPASGVVKLRLEPEELVEGDALQLGLWQGRTGFDGGNELADERAGRALVRVQGLLGPNGVATAVLDGGRGPADRVRLVPWGEPRAAGQRRLSRSASPTHAERGTSEANPAPGEPRAPADEELPWPGRLPAPSPATVFAHRVKAEVLDEHGTALALTERHLLTGAPHRVVVEDGPGRLVLEWAGPWPVDERWWEGAGAGTCARVQVTLTAGADSGPEDTALLLLFRAHERPQWIVEGIYD